MTLRVVCFFRQRNMAHGAGRHYFLRGHPPQSLLRVYRFSPPAYSPAPLPTSCLAYSRAFFIRRRLHIVKGRPRVSTLFHTVRGYAGYYVQHKRR